MREARGGWGSGFRVFGFWQPRTSSLGFRVWDFSFGLGQRVNRRFFSSLVPLQVNSETTRKTGLDAMRAPTVIVYSYALNPRIK